MADDLVDHVRLRRVERCRMMPNVLGAKKYTVREVLEKHSRLHQTRNRLKPKTADCLHLLVHFTQLRNAIRIETQTPERRQIFRAGVPLMGRPERLPDRAPHLMFFRGVRRVRNLIARLKIHSELCDLVAPLSIFAVAESRMIGVELYDRISI